VKEKLEESQFGFREGRGVIDAIYASILNVINTQAAHIGLKNVS